jgi:8-oxo-dGTP pyrophosphatase MutT (NUDIX family)
VTCSYFIYYRSTEAADEVQRAVGAMQRALAEEAGIQGRLMRRADDSTTWMEVYEAVSDAPRFERALGSAVERFALARLLGAGAERHVERFVAVP